MKKKICILLALVVLVQSFSILVSAADVSTSVHHEDHAVCADSEYGIAPCAYTICSCGGTAPLRCGYSQLYSSSYSYCYDTDSHGSCNVGYYKSAGVYKCSSCGTKTNSGMYHYCYETHSSCGKGTVVECDLVLSGL